MNLTVLCYKKCSTCQKALKWLDANGISYVERLPGEAFRAAAFH